ncbi:hypothetical protein HDU90_004210 [Geranomyces variabilis]|nr:hypothetical protein HDU90_004210 [Geranomyces variabilis]
MNNVATSKACSSQYFVSVRSDKRLSVEDCWTLPAALRDTELGNRAEPGPYRPYTFRVSRTVGSALQQFAVLPLHWKSKHDEGAGDEVLRKQKRNLDSMLLYAEYVRVTFGIAVVAGGDFNNEHPGSLFPPGINPASQYPRTDDINRFFRAAPVPPAPTAQSLPRTYLTSTVGKTYDYFWFLHSIWPSQPTVRRMERTTITAYKSIYDSLPEGAQRRAFCDFSRQRSCSAEFSDHHPIVFTLSLAPLGSTGPPAPFSMLSWNVLNSPFLRDVVRSNSADEASNDNDYNSVSTSEKTDPKSRIARFIEYVNQFDLKAFREAPTAIHRSISDNRVNVVTVGKGREVKTIKPRGSRGCSTLKYSALKTFANMVACMFQVGTDKKNLIIVLSVHDYKDAKLLTRSIPDNTDANSFRSSLSEFCKAAKGNDAIEQDCNF